MEYIAIGVIVAVLCFFILRKKKTDEFIEADAEFPTSWKGILNEKVDYYSHLKPEDKLRFEDDIIHFFNTVIFEGVKTEVDITDKLLVASSAVIPVFGFPHWQYHFLKYVVLYPGAFDRNFKFDNKAEYITGMVGSGVMEGRVILSKSSLHLGFANTKDKSNVGIHEFIHLLDKQDDEIDGIPPILNEQQYLLPWLELIRTETKKILNSESQDIRLYAATNQKEFLAVTGEYFFEHPHLLEKNHPELYKMLSIAFNQNTTDVLGPTATVRPKLGRNSDCPCGSEKKYKHCCMGK